MIKACLVVHKVYQNNQIFNPSSYLNRDNCLVFFHELKSQLKTYNIDLQTQDLNSPSECGLILFNEMPKNISDVEHPDKSSVLLFESELIRPDNWDKVKHNIFKNVFTWNDNFVDNKKYFKFNFVHSGKTEFVAFAGKKKLCTLIAGNKSVNHPLELYSERIKAINWFTDHHPEDFDFYGIGWDLYNFKTRPFSKIFNRITFLGKLLAQKWPLYKGPVKDKLETLKNYKFCICYENGRDIQGYITEKIFDALAAGCIPIYWGAPNIDQYIPSECYVDKRKFNSYEELYSYLRSIDEAEYNKRLKAIENYLSSDQHKLFEAAYNAQLVVKRLTHEN